MFEKIRLFLFLILVSSSPLCALYNGSPAAPMIPEEGALTTVESWMTMKVGYLGSDVFNRKLHSLDKFHYWINGGTVSFDVFNFFSIYGYMGGIRLTADKGHTHYLTQLGMCGAVGANVIVFKKDRFIVGLDGKYFQAKPEVQSGPNKYGTILYREGQVGLSAAYNLKYFYPYVGVKVSHASARFSNPHSFTASSRVPVGMALGFAVTFPTTVAFTFEADLIDETAVASTITARF